MYRGRAAASLIPTKTGAARPLVWYCRTGRQTEWTGSTGTDTSNVSLVDRRVSCQQAGNKAEVNDVMKQAADVMPVLDYTDKPLVSIDFNHQHLIITFVQAIRKRKT